MAKRRIMIAYLQKHMGRALRQIVLKSNYPHPLRKITAAGERSLHNHSITFSDGSGLNCGKSTSAKQPKVSNPTKTRTLSTNRLPGLPVKSRSLRLGETSTNIVDFTWINHNYKLLNRLKTYTMFV